MSIFDQLEGTPPEEEPSRKARITWADKIQVKPTSWAWRETGAPGRLPAGAITIAAGREGTGKSTLAAWVAAHITQGTLPGSYHGRARTVFYLAVEDSWSRTITPRLIAAGANLGLLGRFEVVTEIGDNVALSLPSDMKLLAQQIKEHNVALVVLDPLISVINGDLDTHKERDVRAALEPLADMCETTGVTILGIGHFNKSTSSDAASLLTGSGAFKNVARAMFGFARDTDGILVFSQVKNSLGSLDMPSLNYHLVGHEFVSTDNELVETSKFEWVGESDRSVEDVIRDSRGDEDHDERNLLVEYLIEIVTEAGGQISARDGGAKLRETFGAMSDQKIMRARKRAGIRSQKSPGFQRGFVWVLNGSAIDYNDHLSRKQVINAINAESMDDSGGPAISKQAPPDPENQADPSIPHDPGTGPCAKCRTPTRRYGPGGSPLCKTCQQNTPTTTTVRQNVGATKENDHAQLVQQHAQDHRRPRNTPTHH